MRLARALGSFVVAMSLSPAAAAQRPAATQPAQNTVYAEAALFGNLMYSINYERRVLDDLGLHAGVGSFSYSTFSFPASGMATSRYLTVPLTVSYLGLRGRRSGLEVGGGMIFTQRIGCDRADSAHACGGSSRPLVTAFIGYRLHPVDLGFNFRVGVMLIGGKGLLTKPGDLTVDYDFEHGDTFGVIPSLYLSAGASF